MFVVILLIFINRKLVPDADKGSPIGIKTQRITELGESAVLDMDIQFDATDIDPRTGERKVRGDDGKWAVRTHGNSDLSEFDPSVKSSSSWDEELTPLCEPCSENVDCRPRSLVECPDHKLKNFGQGVMNQALSTEAGYDVAGRYWWPLERERCLATAKEKHIAAEAVLRKAVDTQSDLVWRAFVVDESFKQSLLDDGHVSDVLVLDIIGELFESFNMPGLTAVEREIRRFHLAFLNFCLWGEDLFLPLKHY